MMLIGIPILLNLAVVSEPFLGGEGGGTEGQGQAVLL